MKAGGGSSVSLNDVAIGPGDGRCDLTAYWVSNWRGLGAVFGSSRSSSQCWWEWLGRRHGVISFRLVNRHDSIAKYLQRVVRRENTPSYHCLNWDEDTAQHMLEVWTAWAKQHSELISIISAHLTLLTIIRAIPDARGPGKDGTRNERQGVRKGREYDKPWSRALRLPHPERNGRRVCWSCTANKSV